MSDTDTVTTLETGQDDDDFRELTRRVNAAGLMRPRTGQYAAAIAAIWLMSALGWAALVLTPRSWWFVLLDAAWQALWFSQLAFLMHDAGHRQISRSRKTTQVLGLLHGNLLLGVSFGWWQQHHNRHHAHPNHLEQDPDTRRRVGVFTPEKVGERGPVVRFLALNQRYLFFPLLILESLAFRVATVIALRKRVMRRPVLEAALLLAHTALYLGALLSLLSPGQTVVFVLLHQSLLGLLLGLSFAFNHKGMPTRDGQECGWMERQVVTSRTLPMSRLGDFLHGALNYQIEHHLYPAMPRTALRRAYPIVRDFCQERGIDYCETSFADSVRDLATHLRDSARTARENMVAA